MRIQLRFGEQLRSSEGLVQLLSGEQLNSVLWEAETFGGFIILWRRNRKVGETEVGDHIIKSKTDVF
jgi:hypothetical protein